MRIDLVAALSGSLLMVLASIALLGIVTRGATRSVVVARVDERRRRVGTHSSERRIEDARR